MPANNASHGRQDLFLDDDRRTCVSAKNTDSLVWVADLRNGGEFALLQVDPLSGVWVVRSRFPAGTRVQTHLHSGAVTSVTLAGHWSYPDADVFCGPGDFLVEEAAAIHSLVVLEEDADILFIISGSITYFGPSNEVEYIEDWRTVLAEYATGCNALNRQPEVLGDPYAR